MAGNSALPLILLAGGAAMLIAAGRKDKDKKGAEPSPEPAPAEDPTTIAGALDPNLLPGGTSATLVFDEECTGFAEKINLAEHNSYITARYHQLYAEGMEDLEELTLQLLREQAEHCPWDEPEKWTPLMQGIYDQLLTGVKGYHAQATGPNV